MKYLITKDNKIVKQFDTPDYNELVNTTPAVVALEELKKYKDGKLWALVNKK